MISIKGIIKGNKLTLLEKVDVKTPQEVIVTFLDSKEIKYWTQEEIEKMGQTVLMVKDIDNEDYSKW